MPVASGIFQSLSADLRSMLTHVSIELLQVETKDARIRQDPSSFFFSFFLPFEHFEPGSRKHMRSMNTKLPFTTILVSAPGYQLVLMQMLEARLLGSLVESGRRGRPAPGRLDAYRWVQMWAVPSLWSCCMLRFESANIPKYKKTILNRVMRHKYS